MKRKRYFLARLIFCIILFGSTGLASIYLAYVLQNKGGPFFTGLLYTSATIFVFVFAGKAFTIKNLLLYYIIMQLTYLIIYSITFACGYFGMIAGIATSGVGAVATFLLADNFIAKISFEKFKIFILGGIAFLAGEIVPFSFSSLLSQNDVESYFGVKSSVNTMFTGVFVFWHLMIGIKLFLALEKNEVIVP